MLDLVNYFVIVVVCCTVNGVLAQLYDGDYCTTNDGTRGTCKYITKCQSALNDIRKGIYPSDICGFVGTQSIVCCTDPNSSTITKTTTSSTTPRTTTTRMTITTRRSTTATTRKSTSADMKVGARAAEMCKQYAKFAYEKSEDSSLSLIPTFSENLECAFEKIPLIVGGTKASRQEFPHMAQLGYISGSDTEWACGGSLISRNFVLTAGHCLWSQDLGAPKLVRVGITNVSDTNYLQVRNVKQIIRYPDYIGEKYHDIALLKMDRDYEMNPYVRPACIHTQKDIPYNNAIASGWGRIEFSGDDSKDLLKVVLEFFSTSQCNYTYRRDINQPGSSLAKGILEDTMICAGSTKEYRDTCQGDSGGPLQIYHEDTADIKCMYEIVGVTSFGQSCGLAKNVPGVYSRVSAYVKWIEDNVWPR
nr:serine protease persephone-like [Leptinotarsa decemlineata]